MTGLKTNSCFILAAIILVIYIVGCGDGIQIGFNNGEPIVKTDCVGDAAACIFALEKGSKVVNSVAVGWMRTDDSDWEKHCIAFYFDKANDKEVYVTVKNNKVYKIPDSFINDKNKWVPFGEPINKVLFLSYCAQQIDGRFVPMSSKPVS